MTIYLVSSIFFRTFAADFKKLIIMENATNSPALQLRTNRGLLKFVLLGILTLGIYPIVVESHISEELNMIASPHDGKHTMHFCLIYFLFSWLTLGIAWFVWYHRTSERMHDELVRRVIDYDFGAVDFWLWNILGALIVIGPYVYLHKRMKAMNLINEHYNRKG
jgi:hypothetical protein